MIGVGVAGAKGRMGSMLVQLIQQAPDLNLSAAVEHPGHEALGTPVSAGVELSADPQQALHGCDVWLDFSLPNSVSKHAQLAQQQQKPLVTGTTGFSAEQQAIIKAASEHIAIVQASNFSRGVWATNILVELASRLLPAQAYDAEIFEIHHRHKQDAPSGTALHLAHTVQKQRGGETVYGRTGVRHQRHIGMCAARGGDVVGEHQMMFLGRGEQLILTHRATTREHFCLGALEAVRFVHNRQAGLYSAEDVFGTPKE